MSQIERVGSHQAEFNIYFGQLSEKKCTKAKTDIGLSAINYKQSFIDTLMPIFNRLITNKLVSL